MLDKTMTFSLERDREGDIRRILTTVYDALKEKGSHQPNCWLYSLRGPYLYHDS